MRLDIIGIRAEAVSKTAAALRDASLFFCLSQFPLEGEKYIFYH